MRQCRAAGRGAKEKKLLIKINKTLQTKNQWSICQASVTACSIGDNYIY